MKQLKIFLLFAFVLFLTLVSAVKFNKNASEKTSDLAQDEFEFENLSDEELLDAEEEEEDSDDEDDEDFHNLDLNDDEEDSENEDQDDFTDPDLNHKHHVHMKSH
jgi:hypothetical protein